MIKFFLLVNKHGQTRLSQYYENQSLPDRISMEIEVIKKCLSRGDNQCSFVEHKGVKLVYRRYASLYFIVGIDKTENELGILEFIHCVVETFDRCFENVSELDIMYNIEKAHMILDEMIMNGEISETNQANVLLPVLELDKFN
eukprot:Colp12_sorted_trinity150504_noHs@27738